MRRRLMGKVSILMAAALLALTACGEETTEEKSAKRNNAFDWQSNLTEGENGYYYLNEQESCLYYLEEESGEYVKLCGKADCQHNTSDCNAYIEGASLGCVWYADGKVYYTSLNDKSYFTLSCMEEDGSNHEEITQLYKISPNDYVCPMGFLNGDYFYLVSYETEGETLYRVKLEKDAELEKIEEKGYNYSCFQTDGDKIYMNRNKANEELDFTGEIVCYDASTGEEEVLLSYDGKNYVISFALAEDAIYYTVANEGIMKLDLTDKKESVVEKNPNCYSFLYYDGTYLYEDNLVECDNNYFIHEDNDAYKNHTVTVKETDGTIVETISLADNRNLVFGVSDTALFVQEDNAILAYDKSEFGTGNVTETRYE